MGKPVNSKVARVEVRALNTKVNKEVFEKFKDYCKYSGYPMNVLIETFMQQYANGNFIMSRDDIMKWKINEYECDTLNTTFNKEIYLKFKRTCKEQKYFVKHVVMAFMEYITTKKYLLEFKEVE